MQNDKLAMSRALGAAFLSHQVEQLERSVGRQPRNGSGGGRGGKRGSFSGSRQAPRSREQKDATKEPRTSEDGGRGETRRRSGEAMRKDADIVVVDASVLVHALGHLKGWCREGRQEVVVIPLEALNTLDLLKKGSSPLAQRARAASRILEAQVGSNPRIRVQRDDAFVLWDEIPTQSVNELPDSAVGSPRFMSLLATPPEWLRRTICCARWEVINAPEELRYIPAVPTSLNSIDSDLGPSASRPVTPTSESTHNTDSLKTEETKAINGAGEGAAAANGGIKVLLAVVTPSSKSNNDSESAGYTGRYERVDGALVRAWAERTGIQVLDVEPSPSLPPRSAPAQPSPEKRRPPPHTGGDKLGRPDRKYNGPGPKSPVVEKPIAMSIINDQPVKVLRVLARGEKLEP